MMAGGCICVAARRVVVRSNISFKAGSNSSPPSGRAFGSPVASTEPMVEPTEPNRAMARSPSRRPSQSVTRTPKKMTTATDPPIRKGLISCKRFPQRRQLNPGHSDVDHDVALRPGAADQDISLRRRIERIRLVGDGAGDQSALAVVADAGAARPADGHVARFRQLE